MTTLFDLFGTSLSRFGDRVAVRDGSRKMTYAELARDRDRLAAVLQAWGAGPSSPIAIMVGNRCEWLVADQALIRLGAAKVPINHMLSGPEIEYILKDSGARIALVDAEMAKFALAADVAHVLTVGADWQAALERADTKGLPQVSPSADDTGLILYTGGTTGRQKGVVHTQSGLAINLLAHVAEIGLLDDERMLLTSPLPHSAGFLAQAGLLKGAEVLLEPRFDAERVIELITDERITFLFMVPTMIYRVLDAAEARGSDTSSLRTILYGAAPITPERLEQGLRRFGPVFMQLYGQSEAPNFLTRLAREEHDLSRPDRLRSCGRPAILVTIAVLDDMGGHVPTGAVGEICARAPYVLDRYHGLETKTAETLRGGWLHTGDLGFIDADGFVHLLDRKNDMVISGGMNVYTTEVEQVLASCSGVDQVAVVGVPHPDWGEAVVAFIVSAAGFDEAELVARCREEMATYKRPKAYCRCESLPMTSLGKVDKKAMKASWPGW